MSPTYQLASLARRALSLTRFPTFCASLVAGSTLLAWPLETVLLHGSRLLKSTSDSGRLKLVSILAKFIAALLSAAFSFTLLNSRASSSQPLLSEHTRSVRVPSHVDFIDPGPFDQPPEPGLEVPEAPAAGPQGYPVHTLYE